jgi:acetylornithine deacetylase/succinyl-diaminopimelate desuccinylase-like protein
MDTVNGSDEQFIPRRIGGKIFGRGACDTKGSVAAMLSTMCEMARNGRRTSGTEIVFAGLVDEEAAQAGSRALAASGLKADLAIVGEPTKLQVVTAHKGSLWLELETRGKAAHGARPELGHNAVHDMARVVDVLETEYATRLKPRRHRLLGCATVSVGVIAGGTQPNIVPDHCTIQIDRRTLPGETEAGVRREILALLRRRKLTAGIKRNIAVACPALETDPGIPLVMRFLRGAGQRKPAGVDFFCDAVVLSEGGIPSVVFGPGDIALAHTTNEWIHISSLEKAKRMLVHFLNDFD